MTHPDLALTTLTVGEATTQCRQQLNQLADMSSHTQQTETIWLLEYITGLTHTQQRMAPEQPLTPAQYTQFNDLLTQRCQAHKPIQHIIGWSDFMGHRFHVSNHVLIPRPETALLVQATCHISQQLWKTYQRPIRVADVGTGSGCIASMVAHECGDSVSVTGIDICQKALNMAQQNSQQLGGLVGFQHGDVLANGKQLLSNADIVVSNPPYIDTATYHTLMPEVRNHEPKLALHGGDDGLIFYRALIEGTPPGAWLLAEFGFNQGGSQQPALAQLLQDWPDLTFHTDDAGIPRFFKGKKPMTAAV